MRSMIVSFLFTAMLALGAPGHADPVPEATPVPQEQPENKGSSLELTLRKAYTGKRWIGVVRKGRSVCPNVPGWHAEKLTDQAKRKAKGETEGVSEALALPSYRPVREIGHSYALIKVRPSADALLKKLGLDRICIYTPEPGPWVEFVPPSGLEARQDRLAVATTSAGGLPSDLLSARIWQKLATKVTDHTGQVFVEPGKPIVKKPFRFNQQPGVRLTFLDSQPDSQVFAPPTGNDSMHGFTLAHLAQDIVCPSGPSTCAATIESRRALGHAGGQVGHVSDLATAIVSEVLDWRDRRDREPNKHKHLVLNLSLGWDGEGFGDLDVHSVHKLEPSVRAVYEAIRFARKSGALVIAAAGNRRGGSEGTEWPLLPAAWELRRPCWFPLPLGRKPIYAVGGVDWQGLPLPNSRDGGLPRRMAYADHSVTYAEVLNGPTAMYTGTSVSAAVTSSIAAVIWHLRPDLSPSQVMKLITRSGDRLDFRADFYALKNVWPLSKLVAARPWATKLSLCGAVKEACGAQGSACEGRVEAFASCRDEREKPGVGPLQFPDTFFAHKALAVPKTLDIQSQRWVYPQPEATPCPGCSVIAKDPPAAGTTSTEYELVYAIGDEWRAEAAAAGFILQNGVLDITCGKEHHMQSLPKEALNLQPVPMKIILEDEGRQFLSCTAGITFEVTKGSDVISVYNPVLVDPRSP